ncbi:uncharacterized protein Tco025E_02000 [Trypanosoma conorhini]|uniref:Uncharacterized protein n=1 Tax=Trypanosoma conorhini TaxID=83891 RepID=A0A3S5IUH0_9TRYP|nr:uncharacterized protein Tco025E_02000 [Trypanosoma conorhini]RNF25789.1 hypothetical protein Tco025E_02000 [Trypanosoma conorhini]
MRGEASDLAVGLQRRGCTAAALTEEALPPALRPRPRLPSANTDGAPSVVLVGPAPPTSFARPQREHTPASASGVGGDNAMPGHLPRDEEASFQQHATLCVSRACELGSLQGEVEVAAGQASPAMMSRCPRSPSTVAGRYEEATEAGVVSGHFSPTWFCRLHSAAGSGVIANPRDTETSTQMKLQKDLDEAAVSEGGDGPLVGKGVCEQLREETTEFSPVPLCLHDGRLFADCTNVDCPTGGKLKAPLGPAGMNRSLHGVQEDRRPIQYRKCSSAVSCEGFKHAPEAQLSPPPRTPPSSVSVTEGEGSEAPQTRVPHEGDVCGVTRKHWVLEEGPRHCGEAEEEPVLLSVLLDRGCGKRYEEEAAFWRRRCALAEEQLAMAVGGECAPCAFNTAQSLPQRCVSSPPEAGSLSRASSSRPSCLDGIRLGTTLAPGQGCSVAPQVSEGNEARTNEQNGEKDSIQIEEHHVASSARPEMSNQGTAPKTTAEQKDRCILESECGVMPNTLDRLRSECEALRGELAAQVVRNENLETSLVAKEEQQMARREEWLTQEKELRGKREKLATALRLVHRNLASTAGKLEEREKEIHAARARCCLLEAELAASKTEVVGLKDASVKRLEEGQRLQQQLEQLEAELRPCDTDTMSTSSIAGSAKTETYTGDNRDRTTLSDVLREETERRLRGVLAAMRRGEGRQEWIVSQLLDTVKALGREDVDRDVLVKVDKKLQQLVQSLELLLNFELEPPHNTSGFPPAEIGPSDAPLAIVPDAGVFADLVGRAQELVSQLAEWSGALQRRHAELVEELEVVRADRNELVGQQNLGAQHLQQLLLAAEQEKKRLTLLLGRREATIRRLNEEPISTGDLLKQPARSCRDCPPGAAQDTDEDTDTLHGLHLRELERALLHIGRQTDAFADSLHALLMETLVAVAQAHRNQLARAEARGAALQEQLRHLCEEGAARQRAQDDSRALLQAQLEGVQNELADKKGALRTLLQLNLRQGGKPWRGMREERQEGTPQHLVGSTKSSPRRLALSPPLGDEKRGGDVSTGLVLDPPHAALPQRAACAAADGARGSSSAERTSTARGSPSSLVPAAFAGHDKQGQLGHLHASPQRPPGRQCLSLPYSGGIAPNSSSSSDAAATSPPKGSTDRHHSCSSTVQRGTMRKYQEVWMRQAELMGLLSDERGHDESPQLIALLRSNK